MTAEIPNPQERYLGFPELGELEPKQFPQHVLIIPDGNRTWARQRGLEPIQGHMAGLQNTLELLRATKELPISRVSLWAFSNENNRRDEEEKNNLMKLFSQGLQAHTPELTAMNARLEVMGHLEALPQSVQAAFQESVEVTQSNTGQIVNILINFSGMDQEVRMHQKTARKVAQIIDTNHHISYDELLKNITPEWIEASRDGDGQVQPANLIIRTKEARTSGIGWLNGDSTSLYLRPDILFPDLRKEHIAEAIRFYSKVEHNYGV